MEASVTWACPACGAANARYRRRCLDCGERRPADAVPAGPDGPDGGSTAGDVPLPAIARRRRRSGRGWPSAVAVVAVLLLAGYGAATYFGADDPDHDADLAALRAALDGGFDLGAPLEQVADTESGGGVGAPLLAGIEGCDLDVAASLRRREERLLHDGGGSPIAHIHAAYRVGELTPVDVRLFAFRTAAAAREYEGLVLGEQAQACGLELVADEHLAREGRELAIVTTSGWFAHTPNAAPPTFLDVDTSTAAARLLERLELDG